MYTNHSLLFHNIVNQTIQLLKETAIFTPALFTSCKSGEAFESIVVNQLSTVLLKNGMNPNSHLDYKKGSHRFPDIIVTINNQNFGIEVKCSTSNKNDWKINGNSILGSTKDQSVQEIFIIFGKLTATQLDFKARKYEDCIINVVVTHSPRYLIDMNATIEENFFHKSNISYQQITNSKEPIRLITDYFHNIGQKAWWLSESTPATLRFFTDLSAEEKKSTLAYGYVHFPELLGKGTKKYKQYALWLTTEKSIISTSLRDDFSAGGQTDLIFENSHTYRVPQIFNRLRKLKKYVIEELEASTPESLISDWGTPNMINYPNNTLKSKLNAWIDIASFYISKTPNISPNQLLHDIFFTKSSI